jgi:hypothetical protein
MTLFENIRPMPLNAAMGRMFHPVFIFQLLKFLNSGLKRTCRPNRLDADETSILPFPTQTGWCKTFPRTMIIVTINAT